MSWHNASLAYTLQAANGSSYYFGVAVDPTLGLVYKTLILPAFVASYGQTSSSYSGYAIAGNSGASNEVNYTEAWWYLPTISQQSGFACGTSGSSLCEIAEWTGLQNSTYDGGAGTGAGEVIQTGIIGVLNNCNTSCSASYTDFAMYVAGNSQGLKNGTSYGFCPQYSDSVGDEMIATVYSSGGNTYHTDIQDVSTSTACSWSDHLNTAQVDERASAKEYYADYFVERPQVGNASSWYALPKFVNFTFSNLAMISSTTGTYPYYNNGYGFGSFMYNSGTNALNDATVENSGTTYGHFDEDYVTSSGTS